MWNRQQVKEQAKLIMKRNYWKMFVVTLLTGILTGEKQRLLKEYKILLQTIFLMMLNPYSIPLISNIYFIPLFLLPVSLESSIQSLLVMLL